MGELERCFKGLAEITRLRIVNLLTWGELCGCDIQRVLEASQPNISRHLTYLKHAGLVVDRREGFRVFYRLVEASNATIKSFFEFLVVAFRRDECARADLRRLKDAVREGACTLPHRRLLRVTASRGTPAQEDRYEEEREGKLPKQAHRPGQSRLHKTALGG